MVKKVTKKATKSPSKKSASTRKIVTKSKAVKKKPATKKVTSKKVTAKKSPAKVETAPKKPAKVAPTPPIESAPPPRAPVKKVFGANNTVTIVAPKVPTAELPPPPEAPVAPVVEVLPSIERIPTSKTFVLEKRKAEPESAPEAESTEKISWSSLPKTIPAPVRFLMNGIKKEAKNASAWPFPFAKFISTLSEEICGLEFALCYLHLEHDVEQIAGLCGMKTEKAESIINSGSVNIFERFAALCPEVSRKWRSRPDGVSMNVETLIEPYLTPRVDRDLQIMLAAVVVKTMGVNSPIVISPHVMSGISKYH